MERCVISDSKAHLEKDSPEGTSLATATMGDNLAMDEAAPADARYRRIQLWVHRISVLLFVFVCATVGVLLVIFPWHPEWTDNRLLLTHPGLRSFVTNSFVRGVCSGLGLLDIWIGFWEAIHYHEEPRPE
ncbi:MAG: hypothetical protein DMG73_11670 [Acidobacteria bacterium]|nr:MAG: hypothetical protein DMG75_07130 [Acidobacteriota bacterium]PYX57932.1 MAG: hypothetical protein DMG73_11670 [Acidobacteriota bacterium]PYX65680.1 MAG: hypothetical protein DMG74_07455 [Acidobacteriota bacterium]